MIRKNMLNILILTALTYGLAVGQNPIPTGQDSIKIFSLLRPNQDPTLQLPELNNPLIYGISWRFHWSAIEPQDEQYHWNPIDESIAISSRVGKKVMLRVIAGINTPAWVYQSGAKPFEFSNTDLRHLGRQEKSLRMPIPWDEIALTKWEEFIRAFGARYNGNPHIYSIQMAGGGHIGEMALPKALEKWQHVGYSDEKLITAWKRIIDAYQKAFPDIPTNLGINEPLGRRRSNVLEPVVAYVLTSYPHKVYLQQNGLKADYPRTSRLRQIIREASGKTTVGYQMVGGKGFLDQEVGDRMVAFRNALEDHVSYLEVYASDLRDPGQRKALEFLVTQSGRR